MRGVFFYAPSGINGDITITATVFDHPAVCLGYDGLFPTNPQNFIQRPALAVLPASDTYGSFGNVSNVHNQVGITIRIIREGDYIERARCVRVWS